MTTTKTRTAIGTIEVPAGTIHDASFETAAWYRTFEHPAQTCTVYFDGNFVLWTIEGRTTHEHFPSLYGGVAIGGGTMGDCDKPSTYTVRPYNYTAAAMVEAGKLTLNDDFRLEVTYFDHPISCRGYTTVYGPEYTCGMDYVACECDVHEDAHYRPTKTERNSRGFLPFGYKPGVKDRKRHVHIRPTI